MCGKTGQLRSASICPRLKYIPTDEWRTKFVHVEHSRWHSADYGGKVGLRRHLPGILTRLSFPAYLDDRDGCGSARPAGSRTRHRKRFSLSRLSSDTTATLPEYSSPIWTLPVPDDEPPDYPDSADEADEETDDCSPLSPSLSPRGDALHVHRRSGTPRITVSRRNPTHFWIHCWSEASTPWSFRTPCCIPP